MKAIFLVAAILGGLYAQAAEPEMHTNTAPVIIEAAS